MSARVTRKGQYLVSISSLLYGVAKIDLVNKIALRFGDTRNVFDHIVAITGAIIRGKYTELLRSHLAFESHEAQTF